MAQSRLTPIRSNLELAEADTWLAQMRSLKARLTDRTRRGLPFEAPERRLCAALEVASVATQLRIALWRSKQPSGADARSSMGGDDAL